MKHLHIVRPAAILGAVVALAVGGTMQATASSGGGGVERQGQCTGNSVWHLKASPDSGRILVEAENDTGVKGQHWSWRILHNGGVSAKGNAVTKDGGSLKVQRTMIDVPGVDTIAWRSTNKGNGEQCNGSLKY